MGLLFSRWRSKESSKEILERLEKDICTLQTSRERNERLRKQFIGSLILYSMVLYVSCAIVFYLLYFPQRWTDRIIKSLPLLVFPFLILGVKRFLHYVFVSRISKNEKKLDELKEKKKQVLEDVMENETYKVAKELLEKFDPSHEIIKIEGTESIVTTPPPSPKNSTGTELRQRNKPKLNDSPAPLQRASSLPSVAVPSPPSSPRSDTPTLRSEARSPLVKGSNLQRDRKSMSMTNLTPIQGALLAPGTPKPIPVPPRERSAMDKLVEYMIGDGPNNRYALICKQCYSHNGMALREDFEFTAFRCCYCYTLNQARKERPKAPSLEHEYINQNTRGPLSVRNRSEGKIRRPANSVQSVLAARGLQQQSHGEDKINGVLERKESSENISSAESVEQNYEELENQIPDE